MSYNRTRSGDLYDRFDWSPVIAFLLFVIMLCLFMLAAFIIATPRGYERKQISGVECVVAKNHRGGVSCDWPRP